MARSRIDRLLVEMGLAPSRTRAQALIMAGNVLVDETPVTKAGAVVDTSARIRVRGQDCPFVSRGGTKLQGALKDLSIDIAGKVVLDIGASTGGFTDVCLKYGAASVYAIDVGTNQLAYSLRRDERVFCLEKTNARYLTLDMLPGPANLAAIDVSFISITKILVPVVDCLIKNGEVLAMVKPQFEVGREKVGKGGVVRDKAVREEAVKQVISNALELGLNLIGRADARITGPKGNQETFIHLAKT
ncbi:MAG: TlyA family RNA methyltransferase [Proteobacteria bacterium]|nr:TlyA family RNA methyltransferase [Pseudomonadota bacterium]